MYDLFTKLLNMSITASILIFVVVLFRLCLRKVPKKFICILWALVAVRLMCPINIASSFSALNLLREKADGTGQVAYFRYNGENEKSTLVLEVPALVNDSTSPDSMTLGAKNANFHMPLVANIWILGVILMVLYAFVSYWKLRIVTKASINDRDNIFVCDEIGSPFILGIIRPRIYLPSGIDEMVRKNVLAHEQAHIKRLDYIWKPFAFLLLSVYWFNPVIWIAYILLCKDIEAACDEKVIAGMDKESIAGYSEALLKCAAHRRMITVCPIAFGETDVKGRVKNVLHYQKPAFWIIGAAVIACIVVAVCFLTNPKGDRYDINSVAGRYIKTIPEGESMLYTSVLYLDKDGTFTFSPSVISSYMGVGAWQIEGNRIICRDAGMGDVKKEVFRIEEGHLFYIAEESAPDSNWQVGDDAEYVPETEAEPLEYQELIGLESREDAENNSELIPPGNRTDRSDNTALPDSQSDKVRKVAMGDVDYSGAEDYILFEERGLDDFFAVDADYKWTLVLDGEEIYTGYHALVCDFNVCMIDLDRDMEGEIVVLVSPHVNSMPLQEYVVLKRTDGTWKELENTSEFHSKEDTYHVNSFPIHVTYDAASPVSMDISCDGLDYKIHEDISNHYKRVILDCESEEGSDAYVSFAKGVLEGKLYKTGDVFAQPSAWGIWSIRFNSLDGVNYLVASHGIESVAWGKQDILGYLDIWFSYDTQGKIEVFKMEYWPYTQKRIDFSDEVRDMGVADDNFIRTIDEPEKIEKSFSFAKTTGKLTANVTKEAITQPVPLEVALEDSDGRVVWKTEMGIPHLVWNSYYIYSNQGRDYLIEYNPSMSTGIVYYKFILYEFDTNGNAIIVDERYASTSESISDFNEYTKPYLDRAQLFISTIDGVITTGM